MRYRPPIDLLEPQTDLKTFSASLPSPGRGAPFVTIQKACELDPASLRDVQGLYAMAPFRCRTPAPDVRELFLGYDAAIDKRTAACFTGLVNLRIGTGEPVWMEWFGDIQFDGVSISDRAISDWSDLRSLS